MDGQEMSGDTSEKDAHVYEDKDRNLHNLQDNKITTQTASFQSSKSTASQSRKSKMAKQPNGQDSKREVHQVAEVDKAGSNFQSIMKVLSPGGDSMAVAAAEMEPGLHFLLLNHQNNQNGDREAFGAPRQRPEDALGD